MSSPACHLPKVTQTHFDLDKKSKRKERKGRQERRKEGKQKKEKKKEMKEIWREGVRKERELEEGRTGGKEKKDFLFEQEGRLPGTDRGK